jgi:uncharacterized protein (UPF0248 family)
MIPIQDLLHRIRWDEEFGRADFVIGYYDRLRKQVIRLPFRDLAFNQADHFDFQFYDEEGAFHSVPLHRIREVYRDDKLIWQRDAG